MAISEYRQAILDGEAVPAPAKKGNGAADIGDGSPWPDLERFDDRPPVPAFPIDALPPWTRAFAMGLAEQTQTPPDLAGLLVLGALATACAGKAVVEGKPGWREPLNIWTAVALPPASRKSAVFAEVAAPIYQRERELADEWRPRRARAEAELKAAQKAADSLLRKAGDDQRAAADAITRAKELEEALPPCPRLTASDATPEKVAQLLSEQDGRLAHWSAEGVEIIESMIGRYNSNSRANMDVYLKGHAGDSVQVDRMNRPSLFIESALITLVMTIQPQALEELRILRELGSRGLWGRFLFAIPESTVGARCWDDATPDEGAIRDYATHLRQLLDLTPGDRVARLHPDAAELIRGFHDKLEPRLGPDGDLANFGEWAGKSVGLVLRIAGLLHAAEYADQPNPWASPIDAKTMRAALDLGEYALAHALVAWGHGTATRDARKVWSWIARHAEPGLGTFTREAVRLGTKGGRIAKAEDLDAALEKLIRRGYVREHSVEQGKTGRPLTMYEANPAALANGGFRGNRGSSSEPIRNQPSEFPGFSG